MKRVDEGPIPVAEARQRLPQLLRSVEQGEDVRISRRGRPVAVLISVEEYDRLRRRRPSVRDALSRFREVAGEGVDLDIPRDSNPGREVDL